MGSLAMKATERDPDFLANMEQAVKNKRQQSEWTRLAAGMLSAAQ